MLSRMAIFFSFSLVVVVLQSMIIRTMTDGSLSPSFFDHPLDDKIYRFHNTRAR